MLIFGSTINSTTSLSRFELINSHDSALFALDTITSSLSVKQPFDRDSDEHCVGSVQCALRVSLAVVSPLDQFRVITVGVVVLDVDDSPPNFHSGTAQPVTLVRRIAESAVVGRRIALTTPTDRDSPANSRHTCTLASFSSLFRLDYQPGEEEVRLASMELVLLKSLDRERESSYSLKVVCRDGAGNEGALKVKVEVLDVNDHTPRFQEISYDYEVGEDFEVKISHVYFKCIITLIKLMEHY